MGIPKFFRWLSEKYPLINYPMESTSTPEFDYLYLDMNGIIHNCTHPKENDPLLRISESKMFISIMTYIDKLFRTIKPKKGIFMAIDGCAPRAKMNQQRQRRFRSAMESKVALQTAICNGSEIPEDPAFDSNVITPGTEFMERLSESLQFFIRKKIKEDSLWKEIEVIYSGHDVPGEGEHKIMQFLRTLKTREDYQPNLRHCLYGLDADLIMLGLISHEPNFCLIREEVLTRIGQTRDKDIFKKEEFHLLSLTLLREYMESEFLEIWEQNKIAFNFDLERILDDFVLMAFFVGNDFLPNLHVLDIAKGGMEVLFETYKKVLPRLKNYFSCDGIVDWPNLQIFLTALADYEEKQMYEMPINLKLSGEGDDESSEETNIHDFISNNETSSSSKLNDDSWRPLYYKERSIKSEDPGVVSDLVSSYSKGLQWVLHYYVHGCVSWEWFYPYHYSPLISDMRDLSKIEGLNDFVEGKPFLPFEQLLAVLPPDSREALPVPYRPLMISETSPLINFYPTEFKIDMNGKENAWEGVVLIPFIDEKLLRTEFEKIGSSQLTEQEKKRNKIGEGKLYRWDLKSNYPIKSTLSVLEDIENCQSTVKPYEMKVFFKENVLKLHKDAKTNLGAPYLFPTFHLLKHKFISTRIGIKVFSFPSKYPTRVLLLPRSEWCCHGIDDINQHLTREEEINRDRQHLSQLFPLMRRIAYVKYPYQQLGRVSGFSTRLVELLGNNIDSINELREDETRNWVKICAKLDQKLLKKRGINVGPFTKKDEKLPLDIKVHTIVHVQKLKKINKNVDGTTTYEWSKKAKAHPLDLLVFDKKKPVDPRYILKKQPDTLENLFPKSSDVVIYTEKYLGVKGRVSEISENKKTISVEFSEHKDISLESLVKQDTSQEFFESSHIEKLFGLTSKATSILSSSLYVQVNRKKKVDLGLALRFHTKAKQRDGFCLFDLNSNSKFGRGNWLYTKHALDLFTNYKNTYPRIFDFAKDLVISDIKPYPKDIFPEMSESEAVKEIENIERWIRAQPHYRKPLVDIGSLILSPQVVIDVENFLIERAKEFDEFSSTENKNVIRVEFSSNDLRVPIKDLQATNPHLSHHSYFNLGDRVMNLMEDRAISFGSRGTVAGINKNVLMVIWDKEYIGGETYGGSKTSRVDISVPLASVLNCSRHTPSSVWKNNNNNSNNSSNKKNYDGGNFGNGGGNFKEVVYQHKFSLSPPISRKNENRSNNNNNNDRSHDRDNRSNNNNRSNDNDRSRSNENNNDRSNNNNRSNGNNKSNDRSNNNNRSNDNDRSNNNRSNVNNRSNDNDRSISNNNRSTGNSSPSNDVIHYHHNNDTYQKEPFKTNSKFTVVLKNKSPQVIPKSNQNNNSNN